MTRYEFEVLSHLERNGAGQYPLRTLSDALTISGGEISRCLEQLTAKAFLTRKGKRSGWFSMSKKQELVDKLGPIEHQTEELLEELCGNYCRYTSAANGKTRDELLDICEDCPLSRLRDLIGV